MCTVSIYQHMRTCDIEHNALITRAVDAELRESELCKHVFRESKTLARERIAKAPRKTLRILQNCNKGFRSRSYVFGNLELGELVCNQFLGKIYNLRQI